MSTSELCRTREAMCRPRELDRRNREFRYESTRNFLCRYSFSARRTDVLIDAGLGREKSACQF